MMLFSLAVLALLATPGPTNTLLAASGALVGLRRSLRLVPAELAGYLTSITTLIIVAGPLIAHHPGIAQALKLIAAGWLVYCAGGLWRNGGQTTTVETISVRRVFFTTLTNPKALIFAIAIFPQGSILETAPWLALFSGLVCSVALVWISLGRLIASGAGVLMTPRRIWRTAALGLGLFAVIIAWRAVTV